MVMVISKAWRFNIIIVVLCLSIQFHILAQSEETNIKEQTKDVSLSLSAAIVMALENNAAFRIERLNPEIQKADEQVQRSAYDPSISISVNKSQVEDETQDQTDTEKSSTESLNAEVSLEGYLPSGTTLQVDAGQTRTKTEDTTETETTETYVTGTITQSILRGRGIKTNLVSLRKAKLNTQISLFELQGTAEALVAEVENTYWNYILSDRSIEIYERSLDIAEQQVAEVKERIRVGKLAETELAAVASEVAASREQLINARGTLVKHRLNLIQLLNFANNGAGWDQTFHLTESPELMLVQIEDVEQFVQNALKKRADINQARLQVQQGNLEIIQTKNGLLPKLDLFAQIGGSRYANTLSNANDQDIDETSITIGGVFEFPIPNRKARAVNKKGKLSLEQTTIALHNMESLVQIDVRSAHVDVHRAAEQINATSATRKLREETLRIEQEKLRIGRSTSFLISQAQRDLVASRIAEIESIVAYRKALLSLYQASGMLLETKGVTLD